MTYSDYIDLLEARMVRAGLLVNRWALHLPESVEGYTSGRIYYKRRVIELNEPKTPQALFTLAHEGGHWNSFKKWANKRPMRWLPFALQVWVWETLVPNREAKADHEGWKLLVAMKAPQALGFTYADYTAGKSPQRKQHHDY